MKVKVLCRNPDDYQRETKHDIFKVPRNYNPELHPFQEAREYVRALNATKLERVFAKPFLGCLDGHKDGVHCLEKHARHLGLVCSGSYDGELKIWGLPKAKCLSSVQAHNGFVRGLCVDPVNGDNVISVGDDQQIKQWSLGSDHNPDLSQPIHSILSKSVLQDVSHHWKKDQFATCGDQVDIWDHHRASPVRTFKWGVDTVHKIQFAPIETDILAATASDRSIILYDSREQAPLRKVILKLRSNAVAFNPMEAFIFTVANEDYNLYSFDMRMLSAPVNIHMGHTSAVMDVDYAPTGREFVSGSYDKSIRIFEVDKGRSREVYHTKRMQRIMCVLYSMDNKYILSGSDEMNIRIWKARAAEKLGPLRPREQRSFEYTNRLKEKFSHHPEVRRISRHRHIPKHIFSGQKELSIIKESQKRKESNRRSHSKAGTVPFVSERRKHVVTEEK